MRPEDRGKVPERRTTRAQAVDTGTCRDMDRDRNPGSDDKANPNKTRRTEAGDENPQGTGWGGLTPPDHDGTINGKTCTTRDEQAGASRRGPNGCNVGEPKIKGTSGYRTGASNPLARATREGGQETEKPIKRINCEVFGTVLYFLYYVLPPNCFGSMNGL